LHADHLERLFVFLLYERLFGIASFFVRYFFNRRRFQDEFLTVRALILTNFFSDTMFAVRGVGNACPAQLGHSS